MRRKKEVASEVREDLSQIKDRVEATKYALLELLTARELIKIRRNQLRSAKTADRRMKRAFRLMGTQTVALSSDLVALGEGNEVASILEAARSRAAEIAKL